MYRVVTTIHDAVALAATCRELDLPPPTQGTLHLGVESVSGFLVRLPGLRFPVACDTVTGLVAYHSADNADVPYRHLMRFIASYYAIRARRRYVPDEPPRRRRRPHRIKNPA